MKILQHSNKIDLWVNGLLLNPPLPPNQLRLVQFLMNHKDSIVKHDEVLQFMYGTTKNVTMRFDALVYRINKRIPKLIKRKRGHGVYVEK